jgi:hypothetical protein
MMDRIFALLGMALFIGFVGVLIARVPKVDLWIVLVVVVAMAAYDFWRSLRQGPEPVEPAGRP